MKEATHTFCQRGNSMRKQEVAHPAWIPNLDHVFTPGTGQRVQGDTKCTIARRKKHCVQHSKQPTVCEIAQDVPATIVETPLQ